MLETAAQLAIAPAFVGVASLACARWGTGIGGLLSAFPAVVGPLLLITARDHGAAFAAEQANGTLLGLVALSVFVLVYGRLAVRRGFVASLAGAWAAAAVAAVALGGVAAQPPAAVAAATISLVLAYRWLPPQASPHTPESIERIGIPSRMALTALLVASLAVASSNLGPLVGGMLAALPVLASVLAVCTHREMGSDALIVLLRGMVIGMTGFVAFCEVIAVLVVPTGTTVAFTAALSAALVAQATTLLARHPRYGMIVE